MPDFPGEIWRMVRSLCLRSTLVLQDTSLSIFLGRSYLVVAKLYKKFEHLWEAWCSKLHSNCLQNFVGKGKRDLYGLDLFWTLTVSKLWEGGCRPREDK